MLVGYSPTYDTRKFNNLKLPPFPFSSIPYALTFSRTRLTFLRRRQLVGASASECDTIPGRQCMASCFFLLKQFEDVNIYLNSVKVQLFVCSIFFSTFLAVSTES